MSTVKLDDGKYVFDLDAAGQMLSATRNGEFWEAGFEWRFSQAVMAMLARIVELESRPAADESAKPVGRFEPRSGSTFPDLVLFPRALNIADGTLIYTEPNPVASKEAVTLSNDQCVEIGSVLDALEFQVVRKLRKILKSQRDAGKGEPKS